MNRLVSIALVGLMANVAVAGNSKKPPRKPRTTKPTPTPAPTEPTPPPTEPTPTEPATAPSPAPTPPATPAPPTPAPTESKSEASATSEPDVDALRQEYLGLRDELFKSRARANTVASQLYSTRMSIKLTYTTARFYNPTKVSIRLDGASVYDDATGAIAKDDGVRFDGYVAPGRHVITYRVEAAGKDDDSFTSTTETQLVVKAVAQKDLVVSGKAHDTGDIAYAWKRGESGSYGLGIDTSVRAVATAVPKAKK